MTTKTKDTAYVLWGLGLIGLGGLHRIYVGKTVSGLLYLFTFDLFLIGLVLDYFAVPALVAEANGAPVPQPPTGARLSKGTQALIAIGGLMVLGTILSRVSPVERTSKAKESKTTAAEGGVSPTAEAQAQDPQDDIEHKCKLTPGQHPKFVKRESERYDYANIPRVQVRVSVPPGLSRRELQANLCIAAWQAHDEAGKDFFGAVAVLAYASEKVDGMYTAANADFAPEGEWKKADPKVPVSQWRFKIDYAESYFSRGSGTAAAGDSSPTGAAPSEKKRPGADLPPGTFLTKDGYYGALSKESLDEAFRLAASRDTAALDQLIATGAVFPLKAGLEVTVVDHEAFLASTVKLRKRGTLLEFWTVREALETP